MMKEIRILLRVPSIEDSDIDFIDTILSVYFKTNELVITTDNVEDE